MTDIPVQKLRRLPGLYRVEHTLESSSIPEDSDWLAVVRAPEGLTVIRSTTDEGP